MSVEQKESTSKTKKRFRRWIWPVAGVLVVAWISFVSYINWAMHQPPEVFGHVMARLPMPAYFVIPFETLWSRARKGQLNPGDPAPSLTVKKLEDKTPVNLDSLWTEKPVVLVFGSYT
ncbi:MAG: hypothetical protein C5B46_01600 [Proteobacteria bacterium]|nr:MAG: hypothetical protein C5B46_01600 [Pseudomonadota bacterium]